MTDAVAPRMPAVGDAAPDFSLPDDTGTMRHLADARGRWVVLFFYPKDDTPGCTTEACEFRDANEDFSHHGAEVWGISKLDSASKARFKQKFELHVPAARGRGPRRLAGVRDMGREGAVRARVDGGEARRRSWSTRTGASPTSGRPSSPRVTPPRSTRNWNAPRPRRTVHDLPIRPPAGRARRQEASLVGGDERRLRERIQSANANASVCSGPPRRVAHALVTAPVLHEGRPERLLVITAHPDDADFGVAGSVARWVREGTVARLVCCTSGDAGSDDARTDPLELATLREREQRDAAAIVGYESVTYLHQPDGALANDLALREQLVRILRTFRPDTVAAPGSDGGHP